MPPCPRCCGLTTSEHPHRRVRPMPAWMVYTGVRTFKGFELLEKETHGGFSFMGHWEWLQQKKRDTSQPSGPEGILQLNTFLSRALIVV